MHTRLKTSQVATVRAELLKRQGYRCAICNASLKAGALKDPCLDHDHQTGYIRDVLCRNCNQMEGKVFNLARRAKAGLSVPEWLNNLIAYHQRHATPQHGGIFHPTHKTAEEKRLATNAAAKKRRAAAKASNT